LAIPFARAAIASYPDRLFDNEMLLDVIRDARVDLDLEPNTDPAEALLDWIEDRTRHRKKANAESKEIGRLAAKLDETLAALDEKKRALREIEEALESTGTELKKARSASAMRVETIEEETTPDPEKEATLRRLRNQVADLKAEIGEQQAERRQLRKLLGNERKKIQSLSESHAPAEKPHAAEEVATPEPAGKPILPEYTATFRKRLESLAPQLVAKAILAAGRFASQESAIWRQTKPLERLPEHYRIRIGLDHRMILHWQPGKTLRILDLIPRQDLESWIRRQG